MKIFEVIVLVVFLTLGGNLYCDPINFIDREIEQISNYLHNEDNSDKRNLCKKIENLIDTVLSVNKSLERIKERHSVCVVLVEPDDSGNCVIMAMFVDYNELYHIFSWVDDSHSIKTIQFERYNSIVFSNGFSDNCLIELPEYEELAVKHAKNRFEEHGTDGLSNFEPIVYVYEPHSNRFSTFRW